MKIKNEISQEDRAGIEFIVRSSHFFNEEEVAIALELADERINLGEESTYQFLIAINDDGVRAGYSCYGKIPGTESSYDLYWIAVADEFRHQGLGRLLLKETEIQVKAQGGINLYAETAGKKQYEPTQQFYLREGFILEATLKDYYAAGDDKCMFTKRIK